MRLAGFGSVGATKAGDELRRLEAQAPKLKIGKRHCDGRIRKALGKPTGKLVMRRVLMVDSAGCALQVEDYLIKPFPVRVLVEKIEQLIGETNVESK
jgi:hypothetical protein